MAPRLVLLAGFLLLALAAPANAHEGAVTHLDTRWELAHLDLEAEVATADAAAGAPTGGLPADWCGTRKTADDTANAAFDASLPQFKVVYAYPSDRPDRSAGWSEALQADVATVQRFMGAQTGGLKAPRFDMGTSCGPQYVDVQVVQLPGVRADYADGFAAVRSAVRTELNAAPGGPRNVVVLADQLSTRPLNHWWGIASMAVDDSPGSGNASNAGGVFSALWVPDGQPVPAAGWWPEGLLHEITHNLGAVQASAPHSTDYGHCSDGFDVMCYADGPTTTMSYPCATIAGVMGQVYDCGNDDYFSVAPAAGSYLDTHWNVYRNRFLAGCAAVAPACGEDAGGTLKPPVVALDPSVAGTARVGETLTASTGTWVNAPTSYELQWERGDGVAWEPIAGATGAAYAPTVHDVDLKLRVRVIATNADGNAAAFSAPTAAVAGAPVVTQPTVSVVPTAPVADTVVVQQEEPVVEEDPVATPPLQGRATLRIAAGRGRGKRLGRVAFAVAGERLKATPSRVRLRRGRYRLELCASADGAKPRCVRRNLRVKRSSLRRLPVLTLRVPAGAAVRATYAVKARGGSFSARTAKRPRAGVRLRP